MVEVGFHSLRHTYVSLQAEHGTPQSALAIPSNIVDAEFLVLRDPLPARAVELVEGMSSKNWKKTKAELLNPS